MAKAQEYSYELLKDDKIEIDGHTLYRIRALKDIFIPSSIEPNNILKAQLGGYIESYSNLAKDNAWVGRNAMVYSKALIAEGGFVTDAARVYENAYVCGGAIIKDNARIYGHSVVFNGTIYADAKIHGIVHINNADARMGYRADIKSSNDYFIDNGGTGLNIYKDINNKLIFNFQGQWFFDEHNFKKYIREQFEYEKTYYYLYHIQLLRNI